MIAALLLAAGRSSRFGEDKLMALLGGRPVIRWSAEVMRGSTDAMFVVLPPESPAIVSALVGLDVELVMHAGRDDGLASSVRAGIEALPDTTEAVIIALADQPLVSPSVVAQLCERWQATGAMAVAPRYRDGRGHPVLFHRECFPALRRLVGDVGAREVLHSLGAELQIVEIDASAPLDVDTPDALRAVAAELAAAR